jgi:sulfofructosephosphate aldolase
MVAMDQRESLRTMFDAAAAPGSPRVDDGRVVDFKVAVARELGPLASGFLIDRGPAFERVRASVLSSSTGLVLAADSLVQDVGGPVEETGLDDVVLGSDFDLRGVAALKLLLIWRRDSRRQDRVDLAGRFIAEARRRGVLSVLEPVVRPSAADTASWDLDDAIVEAARELSGLGADLYKAQVPQAGRGPLAPLVAACERLGAVVRGPWVVLSQGVDPGDFEKAVLAACRGGASGFLAGRALWSDVVGSPDVDAALRAVAVPRLRRLIDVVDAEARPWRRAWASS